MIRLQSADFKRLRDILIRLPAFAEVSERQAFLTEMLIASPRRDDILSTYSINGSPRSRAVDLIDRLIRFGQDEPGHEVLNYLLDSLLDYIGSGADASFLTDLKRTIVAGAELQGGQSAEMTTASRQQQTSDWSLAHRRELHESLLGAYDLRSLARMLRLSLGKRLDTIVAPSNLENTIFELIGTAERQGWVLDLIHAAHEFNPTNQRLARFAAQFAR